MVMFPVRAVICCLEPAKTMHESRRHYPSSSPHRTQFSPVLLQDQTSSHALEKRATYERSHGSWAWNPNNGRMAANGLSDAWDLHCQIAEEQGTALLVFSERGRVPRGATRKQWLKRRVAND